MLGAAFARCASGHARRFSVVRCAVYSLHRGEGAKATKQLADALAAAEKLRPKLDEYPALRPGSYSNAMEEWAEAALFARWLDARAVPARAALGVADLEVDECVGVEVERELDALVFIAATRTRPPGTIGN